MKKILLMFCVALCLLMTACGNESIVGSWLGEGQAAIMGEASETGDLIYRFFEDGKCEIETVFDENSQLNKTDSYEYTVEDDEIKITSGEQVMEFTYTIDGYVMKLTSRGVTSEFKRID